jgi:4-alpha-glucanotransferase
MNDKSLIEDSEDAVSKGALLRDNSSNEANDSAPAKKTVRKTATDVAPKAAKVEKPGAAKSGKETAKKVAAKKTSEKKAQTVEPKPVKEKKTEAAKKIASAEKSTGKEEEAKAAKLTSAPMQEAGGKKSSTTGGPAAQEQISIADNTGFSEPARDAIPRNIPVPDPELPEVPVQSPTTGLRRITFQLKFHTIVGQSLYVSGNHQLLGNKDHENAFPLSYLNEEYWIGTLEIPDGEILAEDVNYNYLLRNTDGTITEEYCDDKVIRSSQYNVGEVLFLDSWNSSAAIENTYYTEPFQQVLLKENFTEAETKAPAKITHSFRVKAPLLAKGEVVCIIGSVAELGSWDVEKPVLLSIKQGEHWHTVELDLSGATFPLNYKYGVFDLTTSKFIRYEDGRNRVLYDNASPDKLTFVSDGFAALPGNGFKGAGVAVPVFSLRSEKSFGVGEFADLKLMVDWAKQAGLKLVQLLPVNDTTATHSFTDSYPYAAISAFALHPLYLHLPAIVNEKNTGLINSLKEKQDELNSKADVDYVSVMAAKWSFIKQVFPLQKQETFEDSSFNEFFNENAHWLVPYAAFSYFREKYNTSEFSRWPENQTYHPEQVNTFASSPMEADEALSQYYFVQYHLHLQLKDAARYAHQNGIIVKGDIPIGIYRDSCDAWQEPHLFNMDMQAGAPPDDFAVKGQNWGFPTYNWQKMREDGFGWWKKRFKQMSYYFDAFRIDHILGFFRIWSIPLDAVEGIMGHFVPAVPVHVNEFISRGMSFNKERFCNPYIIEAVLYDTFGSETDSIKSQFLNASGDGNYSLKAEFDTQRKLETHFAGIEQTERNKKIKEGLFSLISNVILFELEGSDSQQFHFRIAMDSTSSFRHLDGHSQHHLRELYVNYFFRRQDSFWRKEAMLKLPELKRSTNMLICGEDLGMVPASVPGVMRELAILSLEIQRMPKDPKHEFFHPNDAPYLSVVTPSTHDMSTIRGWWEEDRAATQRFFNSELGQWGTAPYFCEPWINKIILMQHLYSPAMWSIFQLQDILGINGSLRRANPNEERINIPADPKHYWRYRMHLTLEALINESSFTSELKSYIVQSGR